MDDMTFQAMQYLNNSISAASASITTADLSRKNRQFYAEEYDKMRKYNAEQARIAREYNTQERIATQEWNESMWNYTFDKQNEYNAPSAQMQRLTQAGINPNAAAAAISGGVAASQSMPSSSPASSPSPSYSPGGMPPQFNPAEAQASMMNANANAAAEFAQARLSQSMAKKTDEETSGLVIDNKFKPFEKQTDLDHANASIRLMVKQGVLTDAQANQMLELTPALVGKSYAEIGDLFASAALKNQQVSKVNADIALLNEQIETEKHRQKQMDAGAFEAYMAGEAHKSAINLNGTLMSLNEAETKKKDLEAKSVKLANEWREHCHKLGYDPDSHGLDRLIDGTGSVINLFEQYGNNLVDGVKQAASSFKIFSPSK